jgi:uncharacterized membrane protein (UPF0127 family)
MKTGWKFTIVGALIIGSMVVLQVGAMIAKPSFPVSTLTIASASGPQKFTVEVARTRAQQEFGLMFRKSMDADKGMIFLWDKPQVITMWMKNTAIPLDMIFLDQSGTIVHISPDAKPESTDVISSIFPASAVIELGGGTAARLGIATGQKVDSPDLTAPAAP